MRAASFLICIEILQNKFYSFKKSYKMCYWSVLKGGVIWILDRNILGLFDDRILLELKIFAGAAQPKGAVETWNNTSMSENGYHLVCFSFLKELWSDFHFLEEIEVHIYSGSESVEGACKWPLIIQCYLQAGVFQWRHNIRSFVNHRSLWCSFTVDNLT